MGSREKTSEIMRRFLLLLSTIDALPNGFEGTVWPKPQQAFAIGNEKLELSSDFTFITDGLPKDENCLTIRYAADRYWNWLFKEDNEAKLARSTRAFIPNRSKTTKI